MGGQGDACCQRREKNKCIEPTNKIKNNGGRKNNNYNLKEEIIYLFRYRGLGSQIRQK